MFVFSNDVQTYGTSDLLKKRGTNEYKTVNKKKLAMLESLLCQMYKKCKLKEISAAYITHNKKGLVIYRLAVCMTSAL